MSNISPLPQKTQKTLPTKKTLGPIASLVNYNKQLRKKKILGLHKLFQKLEKEGKYLNLFYEVYVALIPNPEKRHYKTMISHFLMHMDAKFLNLSKIQNSKSSNV